MSKTLSVHLDLQDDEPLQQAAEVVRQGGIIVYPTETLYGIGADAFNGAAVRRVQEVKRRSESKPILLIIRSVDMLKGLVTEVPPDAVRLMEAFWPGPLTLIFKAEPGLPRELTQGTGTIGVRVPSSAVCLRLLELSGCPLTSTSANVSGASVPRTVSGIRKALHEGIDLYLDAGELPSHTPSTVLDVSTSRPKILRDGAISRKRLQEFIHVS